MSELNFNINKSGHLLSLRPREIVLTIDRLKELSSKSNKQLYETMKIQRHKMIAFIVVSHDECDAASSSVGPGAVPAARAAS